MTTKDRTQSAGLAGSECLTRSRAVRARAAAAGTWVSGRARTSKRSERSFFSWFEIESFSAAEMQARLRAGMGMCPEHSRTSGRGDRRAGHIMTTWCARRWPARARALRGERSAGPCPACEAVACRGRGAHASWSAMVCRPGHRAAVLRARRHLPSAPRRRPPRLPSASALKRWRSGSPRAWGKAKTQRSSRCSAAPTGTRRAAPGASGCRNPGARLDRRRGLCERLGAEACPVCLSTGAGRAPTTFTGSPSARRATTIAGDRPGRAVRRLTCTTSRSWTGRSGVRRPSTSGRPGSGKLRRLLDRLGEPPAPSRRGRRRTVDEPDRARRARSLALLSRLQRARRRRTLPARAGRCGTRAAARARPLRAQPRAVRAARACGSPTGRRPSWRRRHVDARLGVLAWEVEETARKYAWAYRHETERARDATHGSAPRADRRAGVRRRPARRPSRRPRVTTRAVTGTSERLGVQAAADARRRASSTRSSERWWASGPALELALCALLADGHVLIEDYPGLAKTLIARSFATVTGTRFSRVQFTPDLMPSDVTGASIFNQRTAEFEFRPGPVFTNVLLADEINRAPPKTQAALLEAMQERQVTTDDRTRPLERPFLVLATQNPIEYEGTYPLPEAQLDRFLIRMRVGYPSAEDEWGILAAAPRAPRGRGRAATGRRPRGADRDAARGRGGARLGEHRPLHRGGGRGHAREPERPGRREPARHARADEARPREGAARRARLRGPRRRQGGRRAGAGAPARAAAGAVGAAGPGRGRRPGSLDRCRSQPPQPSRGATSSNATKASSRYSR